MSSFKSSLIFWSRNKGYTAICLFGLAVSLMFVVLIADFTVKELAVDKFHSKGDRIYAIGNDEFIGCAYGLKPYLEGKYPEIEKMCFCHINSAPAEVDGNKFHVSLLLADTTFFNIFDFKLTVGEGSSVMIPQDCAIISETFAHSAFGDKNPIGQTILINNNDGGGSTQYTVTGIHKDFEESIFQNADVILRMEQASHFNPSVNIESLNNAGGCLAFLLTTPGSDLSLKLDEMGEYFKTFYWIFSRDIVKKVTLTPLSDVYFSDIPVYISINKGDRSLVLILLSVGILILIFAIINYINLTVAQSGFRAKEMATRRLLGATRREIFTKMISESLAICTCASIIAYILAIAVDQSAGNLVNSRINVIQDMTPGFAIAAIAVLIVVSIISGLIPASIISGFLPIEVVRGSFRRRTKMVFSKVFITFQNIITIVLIACSITMIAQIYYITHADLGYNTENIIVIDNQVLNTPAKWNAFRSELKQLSCVDEVSLCQGYPLNGGNNLTFTFEDKNISTQIFTGDSSYFEMMGLEILRDNHITSVNGVWFNETAIREMEIPEDTTSFRIWDGSIPIRGIIKDFQYGDATTEIGPVMVLYESFQEGSTSWNPSGKGPWEFLVKVTGDPFKANDQVAEVFKRMTGGEVYSGSFIEQEIQNAYEQQRKTSKILILFTIIGIIISTLGLYAMSTYFIRQRTLEIAVRKVFGSSDQQITAKLVGSFIALIGIAFVISIPIILYAMSQWLGTYTIRISISPWIFITAGTITFLIAFATVIGESVKAAHANPINSNTI